jgi:hypothetical protein
MVMPIKRGKKVSLSTSHFQSTGRSLHGSSQMTIYSLTLSESYHIGNEESD